MIKPGRKNGQEKNIMACMSFLRTRKKIAWRSQCNPGGYAKGFAPLGAHRMAPHESYIRAYLSHWLQAISIKALEHGLERVFTNAPRTCLCFFSGLLVVLVLRADLRLPKVFYYRFVPWKQRIHTITDYSN